MMNNQEFSQMMEDMEDGGLVESTYKNGQKHYRLTPLGVITAKKLRGQQNESEGHNDRPDQ